MGDESNMGEKITMENSEGNNLNCGPGQVATWENKGYRVQGSDGATPDPPTEGDTNGGDAEDGED